MVFFSKGGLLEQRNIATHDNSFLLARKFVVKTKLT